MTCEDCIHYDVCVIVEHSSEEYDHYTEYDCEDFKNKADFVKVVRCEDCKYNGDCARQMVHTARDYVLEQNISSYNKVDFCSYGKRKSVTDTNVGSK